MSHKPDIAERIGTAINELDIDFSRLSLAGWLVSLLSLGLGGSLASLACNAMVQRNGLDVAAGMVFFVTMVAVTTSAFLALRWLLGLTGLAVTKPISNQSIKDANRDTLKRMANAGMDLSAVHSIDFWHRFKTRDDANRMRRQAQAKSFNVISIESNDASFGYDVQIQVALVPTLNEVTATEITLANLAEQCNGHANGWGVRAK